jgi:glycerophosphoryl diester phosphodiesterase
LKKLDAGSWFAPRFAEERLLSLQEAFEIARNKINLYLDCKAINPESLVREIIESGITTRSTRPKGRRGLLVPLASLRFAADRRRVEA